MDSKVATDNIIQAKNAGGIEMKTQTQTFMLVLLAGCIFLGCKPSDDDIRGAMNRQRQARFSEFKIAKKGPVRKTDTSQCLSVLIEGSWTIRVVSNKHDECQGTKEWTICRSKNNFGEWSEWKARIFTPLDRKICKSVPG